MTATIRPRTPSPRRRLNRWEITMLLCFVGTAILLLAALSVMIAVID